MKDHIDRQSLLSSRLYHIKDSERQSHDSQQIFLSLKIAYDPEWINHRKISSIPDIKIGPTKMP